MQDAHRTTVHSGCPQNRVHPSPAGLDSQTAHSSAVFYLNFNPMGGYTHSTFDVGVNLNRCKLIYSEGVMDEFTLNIPKPVLYHCQEVPRYVHVFCTLSL